MIKICLLICFFLHSIFLRSQELDTLKIYPKADGISAKRYQKMLLDGKVSYKSNELNLIDSLLFLGDKSYYIKLYNNNKELILEGGKLGNRVILVGNVKLYYSNGVLKEERYISETGVECEVQFENKISSVFVSDSEAPWGHWKFYDVNGKIVKEKIYSCKNNIEKKTVTKVIKTIIYKKGQKIEKEKTKIVFKG